MVSNIRHFKRTLITFLGEIPYLALLGYLTRFAADAVTVTAKPCDVIRVGITNGTLLKYLHNIAPVVVLCRSTLCDADQQ